MSVQKSIDFLNVGRYKTARYNTNLGRTLKPGPLTERQQFILKTVWEEGSTKAAEFKLNLKPRTLEYHTYVIRARMNIPNSSIIDMLRCAVRLGILTCLLFSVPSNAGVFSIFGARNKWGTVVVTASPAIGGTVTGSGEYRANTVITLTALANAGYVFMRWSDSNTNSTRTITVRPNAQTYIAYFNIVNVVPPSGHFVTLAWDADPPWAKVGVWRVYWGPSSGSYTNFMLSSSLNVTITNLVSKSPYFFAVKAFDPNGLESPFSNEVNFTPP